MIRYPKIQTLLTRDKESFKITPKSIATVAEFSAVTRWYVTEKVDGTNIRIDFRRDDTSSSTLEATIAGRTDAAEIPRELADTLQRFVEGSHSGVLEIMDHFKIRSYTLFGEGYGPKIQKGGGNYRDDQSFILFDILVNDQTWLCLGDVSDAAQFLGLDMVPVIGVDVEVPDILQVVINGFNSTLTDKEFPAEGVVAQPSHPLYTVRGDRIIWKLKTKDFAPDFLEGVRAQVHEALQGGAQDPEAFMATMRSLIDREGASGVVQPEGYYVP